MTLLEARHELHATTLRPEDASEEVRRLVDREEALGRWFREQVEFDRQVAMVIHQSVVPVGLRERILKGARVSGGGAWVWVAPAAGAAVALAACVLIGWVLLWPDGKGMPPWQSEALTAVAKVNYGLSGLDGRTGSLEAVKRMLAVSGSISPQRVPVFLSRLPTYGCKRVRIGGRPATIVCFKLPSGGEAHLVVLESAGLEGGVPEGRAKFEKRKNWSLASWSDGGQTYLLATTAGEAELRRLMGRA